MAHKKPLFIMLVALLFLNNYIITMNPQNRPQPELQSESRAIIPVPNRIPRFLWNVPLSNHFLKKMAREFRNRQNSSARRPRIPKVSQPPAAQTTSPNRQGVPAGQTASHPAFNDQKKEPPRQNVTIEDASDDEYEDNYEFDDFPFVRGLEENGQDTFPPEGAGVGEPSEEGDPNSSSPENNAENQPRPTPNLEEFSDSIYLNFTKQDIKRMMDEGTFDEFEFRENIIRPCDQTRLDTILKSIEADEKVNFFSASTRRILGDVEIARIIRDNMAKGVKGSLHRIILDPAQEGTYLGRRQAAAERIIRNSMGFGDHVKDSFYKGLEQGIAHSVALCVKTAIIEGVSGLYNYMYQVMSRTPTVQKLMMQNLAQLKRIEGKIAILSQSMQVHASDPRRIKKFREQIEQLRDMHAHTLEKLGDAFVQKDQKTPDNEKKSAIAKLLSAANIFKKKSKTNNNAPQAA